MMQVGVKSIIMELEDGTKCVWEFPPGTFATYKTTDNCNTEKNPIKETWTHHSIVWTSNRKRAVK